jgi:hypothetical protein
MALIKVDWNPDRQALRSFALIWLIGFTVIGAVLIAKGVSVGAWVIGAGLLVGSIGLVRPEWTRLIYLGWMGLSYPIGWVMSHLLLLLVWVFLITPIGFLLRKVRQDRGVWGDGRQSYWVEARSRDRRNFFSQF